jgi:hypothetical protein
MYILRIEHPVPDYASWKKAFDADPVGREASGVRRHSILRSADDTNRLMIDLEFETKMAADAMLAKLKGLWERVQGTVMTGPQARIAEVLETREYAGKAGG